MFYNKIPEPCLRLLLVLIKAITKPLVQERAVFILQLTVLTEGIQDRNLEAGTESKTMEKGFTDLFSLTFPSYTYNTALLPKGLYPPRGQALPLSIIGPGNVPQTALQESLRGIFLVEFLCFPDDLALC